MKRAIKYFIATFLAAAAISCSKSYPTDCKVIIVGRILSLSENRPLENIKVTFNTVDDGESHYTDTYTDEYGMFLIEAENFHKPASGIVSAEDPEDRYTAASINLEISWKGPAFNTEQKTFYINDCNFLLEKKK
ncbi:MAG: hypothetical protein IJN02_11780 [Bacteroidales bacterium]|nr:hypothetical protein [Bacteroidales bacterium]MBQ6689895.1 hypothetical protein [Bacteroidales bacterium]